MSRSARLTAAVALALAASPALAHPAADGHAETPATRPAVRGVIDQSRFRTDRPDPKVLEVPEETDAFTFVVFGDRTGGPAEGVKVLAQAVADTNLIEPDLVMTVGDLIEGYNETPEWQEQADEFTAIMDKLECPWFPVAGNHDIYWRDRGEPGPDVPEGEHESNYERHFGPLWYAFDHKGSTFIVLYSDEGDPETGEKHLHKEASQRMSPEQLQWLRETLARAKDAEHVFVFLHHPRWAGNATHASYGDSWKEVHEVLVDAGNVTAAFAGHIHQMRYEGNIDGIEYLALATVGGGQPGTVPRAGFLHQYHIVTVRDGRVAMSAIPVGAAIDPRDITPEVTDAATAVAGGIVSFDAQPLAMRSDGSAEGSIAATLKNPTAFPIDVTVAPGSRDSHWLFGPDHDHGELKPGESRTFSFRARRLPGEVDESFDLPELSVDAEVLTRTARIPVPTAVAPVELNFGSLRDAEAADHALAVDGEAGHISIRSTDVPLAPDSPMTLEAWMRADAFGERVGLVSKAQSSDYGIFVSEGRPSFSIYLGDGYTTLRGEPASLSTDRWHHVAGVWDGQFARLYVNGQLVASRRASGPRKTNELPLVVGADVGGGGEAGSFFDGQVDEVRLSSSARYDGDAFEPAQRLDSDDSTLLLLHLDEQVGSVLFDDGPAALQLSPQGGAGLAARQ